MHLQQSDCSVRYAQDTNDFTYVLPFYRLVYVVDSESIECYRSEREALNHLKYKEKILYFIGENNFKLTEILYKWSVQKNKIIYVTRGVYSELIPLTIDDFANIAPTFWNYAPSVGGPRPIRYEDYFFSLARYHHLVRPNCWIYPKFKKHLLCPYLSFLHPGSYEALARLVGLIGDPRWFQSVALVNDTDIYSVIASYLGMRSGMRASFFGTIDTTTPMDYAVLSWYHNWLINDVVSDPYCSVCVRFPDLSCPDVGLAFIRKMYTKFDKFTLPKQIIRVSRYFVQFLVDYWLWVEAKSLNQDYGFPEFSYLPTEDRERIKKFAEMLDKVSSID